MLPEYCPTELQRAPRSFSQLTYWRAHEYSQFILYLWYPLFHDVLGGAHRSLLLILHVYTRILCDSTKVQCPSVIEYTINLAKLFIALACETFGDQFAVYNVHGLLHVSEDVFRFGCLERQSCFKYEAFMYILKHLVRSGRHPLKQAVNRYVDRYLPFKRINIMKLMFAFKILIQMASVGGCAFPLCSTYKHRAESRVCVT